MAYEHRDGREEDCPECQRLTRLINGQTLAVAKAMTREQKRRAKQAAIKQARRIAGRNLAVLTMQLPDGIDSLTTSIKAAYSMRPLPAHACYNACALCAHYEVTKLAAQLWRRTHYLPERRPESLARFQRRIKRVKRKLAEYRRARRRKDAGEVRQTDPFRGYTPRGRLLALAQVSGVELGDPEDNATMTKTIAFDI